METVTGKIYLMASMDTWRCEHDEKVGFYISNHNMNYDKTDVCIGEMDVSMDVPDDLDAFAINEKFIEGMRKQQETIKAEASLKVDNIEEQIQSLLALPAPVPND